jgi:hypothetical protein
MRTILFAVTAALLGGTAAAQSTGSDRDTIVVTGERTEEIARAFVGAASATPARRDQLPRWDHKICAGVAGLSGQQAQFLVDRISQRAFSVGLRPEGARCRANVLIVFTPDPTGFAQAMLTHQRHFLGDVRDEMENTTTRGPAALESFLNSTQPVRWWHVSATTTSDGQRVPEPPHGCMTLDPSIPGCKPPVVSVHGGHTSASTREDFRNVLIVVDSHQLGDVTVGALSDYIAMASLAQLNPAADMSGYDSILNLFAPHAQHVDQMTAWDVAYLQGLYHTVRNPFHARFQERQIAHRMAQELGETSGTSPN